MQGRGDDAVIVEDQRVVTRRELVEAVSASTIDIARQAPPRRRVGVLCPNDARALVAWFAAWGAGCAVAPLNPRTTDVELAASAERYGVGLVLAAGAGDAARVGVPVVVVSEPTNGAQVVGPGPGSAPDGPSTPWPDLPDGVALLQSTSGTTGPPKVVPLRETVVLDLLERVAGQLGGTERPSTARAPNLIPVSLSLWAGIYSVLFALRVGAPVVLMDRFEPRRFAELVRHHQVRSVALPPAAMSMLVEDETIADLSPLRYVRSITAPLRPDLAKRFVERFSVGLLNGYGQTELGGEVVGWTRADWSDWGATKLGSVGRPHPGVDLRTVDEQGVATHDGGELQVRTPATAAGELPDEVAARRTVDGFLATGDLARIDDDGFVWIDGRLGAMINRGGLKVDPEEVAEALRSHPAVADAAIVPVPDRRLGEAPWAFVALSDSDGTASHDELAAWLRGRLAGYKVPVGTTTVDALPRTEVGKVAIGELRDRAQAEREAT